MTTTHTPATVHNDSSTAFYAAIEAGIRVQHLTGVHYAFEDGFVLFTGGEHYVLRKQADILAGLCRDRQLTSETLAGAALRTLEAAREAWDAAKRYREDPADEHAVRVRECAAEAKRWSREAVRQHREVVRRELGWW